MVVQIMVSTFYSEINYICIIFNFNIFIFIFLERFPLYYMYHRVGGAVYLQLILFIISQPL